MKRARGRTSTPSAKRPAKTRPVASSLSKLVVSDTDTIQAAMMAIENNDHRSVVVVNAHGVAVGTVSDGDIRKSLLDGRLLATPVHRVMNMDFIALTDSERSRAPGIFQEKHIFLIPLIDERGKLLDVLTAY